MKVIIMRENSSTAVLFSFVARFRSNTMDWNTESLPISSRHFVNGQHAPENLKMSSMSFVSIEPDRGADSDLTKSVNDILFSNRKSLKRTLQHIIAVSLSIF